MIWHSCMSFSGYSDCEIVNGNALRPDSTAKKRLRLTTGMAVGIIYIHYNNIS